MSNLAAALMAAAEKYDKSQLRADFCIGTYYSGAGYILIYTGSGQSVKVDAANEVMYTESLVCRTLLLAHDHGGAVPPDLVSGVAGRRQHPDEPIRTRYGLPNPIRPHCDECFTLQEKLYDGDILLMLRVAGGKQYIALSKLYDAEDTK